MSSLKLQCPPQTYSRLFRPWDMTQRTAAAAVAAQEARQAPALLPCDEHTVDAMNIINEPQNLTVNSQKTEADIKVEFLKVEDVATDVDQSESDDEELEVDDDDYMHTSRTSECASSQSNCSLSDEIEPFPHEQPAVDRMMTESSQFPTTAARPSSEDVYGVRLPRRHTMPSLHSLDTYAAHTQHRLPLLPNAVIPTTAPAPTTMPIDLFYATNAANVLSGTNQLSPAISTPHMGASGSAAAAAAANFVGMDAYAYGLMEQEYARIMAEEAHLKAINARKQRPKKFKCPHCDVAFSNNGQLKGHIRIHTGERPFKCDVESCGKTFTRNEELTRHKRIHTGLRPYPCSACGKKFGRRDHLKKHMKTHMPQERQMGPAIFVPMYPYLYGY